jgi:signal transduction histidine kinase
LQPGARRIVVVSGVAEIDRRAEQQAREALAKLDERVPVEFLSGLPLPELVARVAAQPPDSSVIYMAQFRDRDGRPYEPHDVLRALVKTSRAPVYGAAESLLGLGAAAGSVASYESRGRLIGEQVRRALAGGPPDPSRIVLAAPNRCVADARALQRWSLDERRLPSGCEIRFKDVPIWRQYWWQSLLMLAIVAAQATLIAALLAQRRRRRLAEQAEQAQRAVLAHAARLAMAGELTGAIAHEINQPLSAILSNAEAAELMLAAEPPPIDEVRHILADIRSDDLRASEVIRHLRSLLAKHAPEMKPLDFNALAADILHFLAVEASRRGVALDTDFRELPPVYGDRVQLQQALLNLILNAMDAMADTPEAQRRITVRTAVNGSGGVEVAVSDAGHGIPAERLPNIFDSFTTSKKDGMGLGLSIARSIVEAHGGKIRAENNADKGATFRFTLPASGNKASPGRFTEQKA